MVSIDSGWTVALALNLSSCICQVFFTLVFNLACLETIGKGVGDKPSIFFHNFLGHVVCNLDECLPGVVISRIGVCSKSIGAMSVTSSSTDGLRSHIGVS